MFILSFIPLFNLDIITVGEVPCLCGDCKTPEMLYLMIPVFPHRPWQITDDELMPVFGIGKVIAMFIVLDKDTSRNKTPNSHGEM